MEHSSFSTRRRLRIGLLRALMGVATALTAALVLFLIVYVLTKGLANITWELLSTKPSYLRNRIGILPDILNTLYVIAATLAIVLPLGVGAAIYLTEYASNKKLVAVIEYAAETLSGIPSIIYGLVGMLCFCQFFGLQTSLLAGSLTLVIVNLPTIMRTVQESLKTVPQSYREGALALGAGKWRMVRTVVLPNATVKIFLTASAEARAQRRAKELAEKGQPADFATVLADIRQRDYQDSHRAVAPLKQADDAILVDTSSIGLQESFDLLKRTILAHI